MLVFLVPWIVTALVAAAAPPPYTADWPRYRGPNGTGIAEATGLPDEVGPNKNVAWKTKTPKGNSSPIVIKGRVFFTGYEADQRFLLCYDAATGKELWRRGAAKARTEHAHPLNGPTTPTPATDGKLVFAFFPDLGIIAYDFNGAEKWRVPMGPFSAIQGVATSPLYAEGTVIQLVDSPEEAYLLGLDARTGRKVFKTERPVGFLGSYSTPSLFKPKSGPLQVIVGGAVELSGYQAKTGERLWWARGVTTGPAALPLVTGDSVYTIEPAGEAGPPYTQATNDYDKNKDGKVDIAAEVIGDKINDNIWRRIFKSIDRHFGDNDGVLTQAEWDKSWDPNNLGGGLVRTRLDGKGDVTGTHVGWRQKKGMPYVTAPLLMGSLLYVVKDGGILSTYNVETGDLVKQERLKDAAGQYYASPVAGDGKIYFVSKEGKVTVVRPGGSGGGWDTVGSGDLDEQVIATPAIAGNRLFVRTEKTLYCFRRAASHQ